MNHPMRCQCGTIQGYVDTDGHPAARAVCYCKDCQAYARFLGQQDRILDAQGGTEVVAAFPGAVHFTAGQDQLVCMSLSEKGPLRWYAGCCRTAIGNTARDRKIAYVGLVHTCLAGADKPLDESFGPLKIALNTESACGEVGSTPAATLVGLMKIMRNVVGARLSGKYRDNPFFERDSGAPLKAPQTLTPAERKALDTAA